jgi:TorA maturation chaperone TorD
LHPEGAMPPVMSLWRDGQYDGDPARSIRQIADAANRELAEGARSAPPDHLGCILLLWGELCESRRELADLLRTRHLAWAELALQGASKDTGFYGAVSRAAISLIRSLL